MQHPDLSHCIERHWDLDLLIEALRELRTYAIKGQVPLQNYGICNNWYSLCPTYNLSLDFLNATHDTVARMGAYWPFTRLPGETYPYPIKRCPVGEKWVRENKELRLNLINFILMHLCLIQERRASNG